MNTKAHHAERDRFRHRERGSEAEAPHTQQTHSAYDSMSAISYAQRHNTRRGGRHRERQHRLARRVCTVAHIAHHKSRERRPYEGEGDSQGRSLQP